MNLFRKLLRCAAPFAVLLVAACSGGTQGGAGILSGTVSPVITVSTLPTGALGIGVAADASGNLYVAGIGSNTISKITVASGVASTFAGTGLPGSADGPIAAASFNYPEGVAADAKGDIYVADSGNNTIRMITPAGSVFTLAGTAGTRGSVDSNGAAARFDFPVGIAIDTTGNLYVTEAHNDTIRKITPAGTVSTVAGKAGAPGSADGTGAAARFNSPYGIAIDSANNLYVADTGNNTIRKITPAGVVSTLAGTAGVTGSADGTGTAAAFQSPYGIAVDAQGNVYVSDTNNSTMRKITPAGVVSTVAGKAGVWSFANGAGPVARFAGLMGMTIDPNGIMYVVDTLNGAMRKIGPGYTIGGTVSGLAGALILQNSNGDTKTITANASFTFDLPVEVGGAYSATVKTPPAGQTCTVTNGSGTATAYVTNISVTCTGTAVAAYTIGGTVSGLSGTLILNNSNGEKLTINANGTFGFAAPVAAAGAYSVAVATQPTGQTCTVTSGSGTASANVSNISVSCAANSYTIGGTVVGLTGTVVLQDNGGDNLSLTTNGNFTFATKIAYNAPYSVAVLTQPTGQTCSVSGFPAASGKAVANVTTLLVSCVTNTYTIGGAVTGLTATGLVLQDNGGDNLTVNASGGFSFPATIAYNGAYNVTVLTQPAGQTCTVTGGTGTATANVSNVAVSCVTPPATYTVGGNVMGFNTGTFSGTLVLQNNGADNLVISPSASGIVPFTFATPISGAYSVTVLNQPTGGTAGCTVSVGGSGIASASSGTGVTVTCI